MTQVGCLSFFDYVYQFPFAPCSSQHLRVCHMHCLRYLKKSTKYLHIKGFYSVNGANLQSLGFTALQKD